jgi:MFS family permease
MAGHTAGKGDFTRRTPLGLARARPPGLRNARRFNLVVLATAQALFLNATIIIMVLSGLASRHLGADPGLATLPIAAMTLGTMAAALPASFFMQRFGRRYGLVLGAWLGGAGGAGLAALGIATGAFWLFTLGHLLLGVYQAFALFYRFAAAEAAGEALKSRAISLVLAGGVVAAFTGPALADWAQRTMPHVPFLAPYALLTGLGLVAGALLLRINIPVAARAAAATPRRPLNAIVRGRAFSLAVLAGAVGYAVMVLLMTASPLAMTHAGHSIGETALAMRWHVLGMFVPSFFTGHLIARFGVRAVLQAGAVVLLASIAVAYTGTGAPRFWLALALLGIGWNFLFVGGSTLLTEAYRSGEQALAQGAYDFTIFGTVSLGALLAGALHEHLGWAGLNLAAAPLVVLVLIASYRRRASGRIRRAEPAALAPPRSA